MQISIDESAKTIYDPMHTWEDHEACWKMQYRGSLGKCLPFPQLGIPFLSSGESLLHVLIICDSPIHTRIARLLLKNFPKSALDKVEGEEYLGEQVKSAKRSRLDSENPGATGLHLAIAYNNDEVAEMLIACGASPIERARGVFFMPTDQQSDRPVRNTTYAVGQYSKLGLYQYPRNPTVCYFQGLAYMGEYPLAWSACLCNEGIYNLLLLKGADPDAKDSYGNTVLHMVVVADQLGMYGYALRHPLKSANANVRNHRGLTCLTLSCELGRDECFKDMLELSATEFWRYSNITCCGYPLGALDSIEPSGQTSERIHMLQIL